MSAIDSVLISTHTTSSTPRPHIIYVVKVFRDDGAVYEVLRRYSQFVILKDLLGGSFPLPPKRAVATSIKPFAWVDDNLIKERMVGLQMYLTDVVHDLERRSHPEFLKFLAADGQGDPGMGSFNMVSTGIPASKAIDPDNPSRRKIVAASYYPAWCAGTLPPSKIDFSKFDILFFAFVTPNGTAGINWDDGSQEVLRKLVSAARASGHGTKVVLSVGGWSGSHWYSQAMSTASNRTKFIDTLVATVESYDLDGIDVDWEYPNSSGAGNPHSSADAANLLCFFKALRNAFGSSKIISAAVTQAPWIGENGSPLKDVSEYATYMSYVNIMNYDVFDSSAHPGPNAPLGDLCGSSTQPKASAKGALAEWTKAGMPASKLILGLPLYGYVSKSMDKKLSGSSIPSASDPRSPFVAHLRRPRSPLKGAPALGDLSSLWGQQIAFSQLVSSGALLKNQDGNYDASNGYTMGWDNCSDTPFIFNTSRTTVVSYDDTYSVTSKTKFAKASGMGGCFTWSMDQDDDMALHSVLLHNLGK